MTHKHNLLKAVTAVVHSAQTPAHSTHTLIPTRLYTELQEALAEYILVKRVELSRAEVTTHAAADECPLERWRADKRSGRVAV